MTEQDLSRRSILRVGAVGAMGVGASAVIAACSSDKASSTGTPSTDSAANTSAASTSSASTSSASATAGTSGSTATAPSGTKVAQLGDVPVGGAVGKTLSGDPIILSQPSVGKVVAMSAICPHQGCTVAPADKQLQCPCHQSAFDLSSGEPVVNTATDQMGPAQSGLTTLTATVFQGAVYVSAKG